MNTRLRGGGHVYVVQGDLKRVACDAVLVPTDVSRFVEPQWGRWAKGEIPDWEPTSSRVTLRRVVRDQSVRYLDVGTLPNATDVDWLIEAVHEGLSAMVRDLCHGTYVPLHGRARALVGMPLVGIGAAGFGNVRGEVLEAILKEADAAARRGLDVVIVCRPRAAYAAIQSHRGDGNWGTYLSEERRRAADHLGLEVREGSVALFLGAGVSRAAGLPDWSELLMGVASEAGVQTSRAFHKSVKSDPASAASVLQDRLGTARFRSLLRSNLTTKAVAVGHAILASMRISEAVTTNVDGLYETACDATFGKGQLSVLPWYRMPGKPPWLLKLHGDLKKGGLVFTRKDYRRFHKDHGVLGAVVQSLLVTRNLVFVGYSMRDENFLGLAREVAVALRKCNAPHRAIGTVLALTPVSGGRKHREIDGLNVIEVGDDDPALTAEDARRLEIFLDRMAWVATREERSWVLDDRYRALLTPRVDAPVVERLLELSQMLEGDVWNALRQTLSSYGLETRAK